MACTRFLSSLAVYLANITVLSSVYARYALSFYHLVLGSYSPAQNLRIRNSIQISSVPEADLLQIFRSPLPRSLSIRLHESVSRIQKPVTSISKLAIPYSRPFHIITHNPAVQLRKTGHEDFMRLRQNRSTFSGS